MSDKLIQKNTLKQDEMHISESKQHLTQNHVGINDFKDKQEQTLPKLEEVNASEVNLNAFRQNTVETSSSPTFTLKRSLDKFNGIFRAARFMAEDTDSKSALFQGVETSYQTFMDKTSEKGAAQDGNIYIREFLLFRDAVVKYLDKNGGIKLTSKGRRRRDNMRKLLDQINAIDKIPGFEGIPSAETFTLYADYMGENGLANIERDYTKAHAKLTEKGFIDENENLKLIDVTKDEDQIKRIIQKGSFDDRYITYLKLAYIAEAETRCSRLTGTKDRLQKVKDSDKLQDNLMGLLSSDEYVDKHAKQFNSIRTPMIEYSQRVLKDAFNENLKKLGVTEKEASKDQARIAFLMALSTKTSQIAYQFLSDGNLYLGTEFGNNLKFNIPILEKKTEFNQKAKIGDSMEGFNRDSVGSIKQKFIETLYANPEHALADKMKEALYNEEKSFFPSFIEAAKLGYIENDPPTEAEFDTLFNKLMVRNFVAIEASEVLRIEKALERKREEKKKNKKDKDPSGDDSFAPPYDRFEEIYKYEGFLSESNVPEIKSMLPLYKAFKAMSESSQYRGKGVSSFYEVFYKDEVTEFKNAVNDYLEKNIWTCDKETRKQMTILLARLNLLNK